jgi:hypothetical protein
MPPADHSLWRCQYGPRVLITIALALLITGVQPLRSLNSLRSRSLRFPTHTTHTTHIQHTTHTRHTHDTHTRHTTHIRHALTERGFFGAVESREPEADGAVELDESFWKDGLQFGCTGCGRCCQNEGEVWLNSDEFHDLVDTLKLPADDVVDVYIDEVNGWVRYMHTRTYTHTHTHTQTHTNTHTNTHTYTHTHTHR